MKKRLWFSSLTFLLALVMSQLFFGLAKAETPELPFNQATVNFCHPEDPATLFCEDFDGQTFYKDEYDWARWFRFSANDPAAQHINGIGELKLQINTLSSATDYSNANISTSKINQVDPFLNFGVNTRAEARIRFSPNVLASGLNPGTAKGSAGFLFWNYFKGDLGYYVDPEDGNLENPPQDVLGFIWMDNQSTLPGWNVFAVVNGIPAMFQPIDVDMSQYHVYAVERTHDYFRFFLDGVQLAELPINQEGGYLFIPDEHKLATDVWFDNASYNYNLLDFSANLTFHQLAENQWVDTDYVRVTQL
jgi:hypothetical protein